MQILRLTIDDKARIQIKGAHCLSQQVDIASVFTALNEEKSQSTVVCDKHIFKTVPKAAK